MIDKDRLTLALHRLMTPGSCELKDEHPGPYGRLVCGTDLDTKEWALWSAEGMAEDIIEAYEAVHG